MLAAALGREVAACIAAHAGERDEDGRRLVMRNGHARPAAGDDGRGSGGSDGAAGERQPHLAVGDGALGFWAALAEVFPET